MNHIHQTIINSIVKKADKVCPDSLALIGTYGSVATGDDYHKSDLDLMILINDDNGWKLGCGFILDDTNIGYDIYCTNWEGLEWESECHHAHLSKLLDSQIVYVKQQVFLERYEKIRDKAKAFFASEQRNEKATESLKNAKLSYAEVCLTDSISKVRTEASNVIGCLLDTIMLFNGRYFKLGIKRTFQELEKMKLSPCFKEGIYSIVNSEDAATIKLSLASLINYVADYIKTQKEKEQPCAENITGSYEEMFSNWRNKVEEAANNGDPFASFMNLCSLQKMIHEMAEDVDTEDFEIMDQYNPNNLMQNIHVYDIALEKYKKTYDRAGISPKHFANVDEFTKYYLSCHI